MRHNTAAVVALAALAAWLRAAGRLNGKRIVIAARRKMLAIRFGALKTGKPFGPARAMPA